MEFSNYQDNGKTFSIEARSKALEKILNIYSEKVIKSLVKQGILPSDKRFKNTIVLSFNIEVADE